MTKESKLCYHWRCICLGNYKL